MSPGLARAGVVLSAFAIFTCGWLAMHATDWVRILLYSALALAAGGAAQAFSRHAKGGR